MADLNAISKSLRQIVLRGRETTENIIVCTVTSVDLPTMTCVCQPLDTGFSELLDVQLVTAITTTNFIVIPAVDSFVGVLAFSDIETCEYTVLMTSEVETIYLRGDQYDGIVKVGDLVTKLNNLENKVNTILSSFNSHTHIGNLGAPTSPPAAPIVGVLVTTVQADLENTNVKHG
jgi:hypothetical protein